MIGSGINFSFTLPDSFVDEYRDKKPPFGYVDAAGTSMGEVVFARTYSRKKEDGAKEQWYEVCERVINGMFSIQKDHCLSSRLPWNGPKALATAKDAYDRLFHLKWSPPGRGLWMMGSKLVNEQHNAAALQNCFSGDTKFITKSGITSLADECGNDVEVLTADGWHKAAVKSFGEQEVQLVTFAPRGLRSNIRRTITVTPDHRWELLNGDTTTCLAVGDSVPSVANQDSSVNDEGFRHGLIFADGSTNYRYKNGDYSHIMRLCGDKARYQIMFDTVHFQPNCNGDPVVYHRAESSYKELPTTNDPSYVKSFISGWAALDGHVKTNGGSICLDTQDSVAADWLVENAALAGFIVTGDSTQSTTETNYGERKAPLRRISLMDHLNSTGWTVKSIESLDEKIPVYCAVVPGLERFTLAEGIYTSNCAFVSTRDMTKFDPAKVFAFLMEGSMLGIGMGFDTKGSELGLVVQKPKDDAEVFTIPDTREGWVEATKQIINAYLVEGKSKPKFDYTAIRPSGTPIKTFGGTASGPAPLITLHENLVKMFEANVGEAVGAKIIADIGNMIGVCVVSGNVRRSAELLMGSIEDAEFLNLKNLDKNPDRSDWYWMSNNSVEAKVGDDLSAIAEGVKLNGEPGVIWMDVTRKYGRLKDAPNNKDWRAAGYNPCAEQSLESFECCTLSESYLMNSDSLEDYLKTLKVAYLYAKTVTLLPTHWPETNAIMQRNRRIGMSMSGIADFVDSHGLPSLREYMDKGYDEVQRLDEVYSEWLCVRPSIKTTTVKPSGTVSLLAGTSPGVHWTVGGSYFIRRVIFDKNDPVVEQFRNSGYPVIESAYTPETSVVVEFPIKSKAKRSEADVSIFEKAFLASEAQRYWSDNSVSVTVSFDPETEGNHIEKILHMYEGSLKTVSFLPMGGAYPQMPYESITEDEWEERRVQILPVDLSPIYGLEAEDATGEKYCSTDACLVETPIA